MRTAYHDVVGREALRAHAEPGGGVRLWIEVEDEDAPPVARERSAEIDGGRRLADAALLIRQGDDRAPPAPCRTLAPNVSRETSPP
jgi:hypothetical protein